MKNLSLRWIVAGIVIALMALTAGVSLGITFHFSLLAGKSAGTLHAEALSRNARDRLEHTLGKPIGFMSGLQYVLQQDYNPLPSDNTQTYTPISSAIVSGGGNGTSASAAASGATTGASSTLEDAAATHGIGSWFIAWWTRFTSAMAADGFSYQFAVMGFDDGNYAGCKMLSAADAPLADEVHQCRVFSWHDRQDADAPTSSSSATSASTKGTESIIFQRSYNSSSAAVISQANTTTGYDPRTRSWYHMVEHQPKAMRWSGVYLSAMPTLPIVDVNAAMFNATGDLLGVASLTFELSFLSDFIENVKGTAGSRAVLIDNDGLLLASNYAASYVTETNITTANKPSSVASNCLLSDVSNDATRSIMLCRHSLLSYPWSELNEIALEHPALLNVTGQGSSTGGDDVIRVERLSLANSDGKKQNYFVAVTKVSPALSTGMNWRFVTLVPEVDVTGTVIEGRNIAVAVVTTTTVLSGILCVFLLYKLLSPLQELAWGMYDMATMRDDTLRADFLQENDKNSNASMVEEVHTLQEAFGILSSELRKVKSYLPTSVLIGLYPEFNESEEEDEDEEDEKTILQSGGGNGATPMSCSVDARGGGINSRATSVCETGSVNSRSSSATHQHGKKLSRHQSYQQGAKGSGTATPVMSHHGSIRLGSARLSGAGAAAAGVHSGVGGLNTELSLTQRRVTIMQCNLQGFHGLSKRLSGPIFSALYGELVDLVFATVQKRKGVVQSFHGDRFMVSFNAATFAGNQCSAAAQAGLELVDAVETLFTKNATYAQAAAAAGSSGCYLHVGIASGQAQVGNMGSVKRRQFCVVGSVVNQAAILERLCYKYGATSSTSGGRGVCLAAGSTSLLSDISPFVEYKLQDCVQFPATQTTASQASTATPASGASSALTGRLLVASLVKVKESRQDEWMYQLEESDANSTTAGHNSALERLMEGKADVALQLWETHLERVKEDPVAEAFVQLARSYLARGKDSSTYATSTADYYGTCILKVASPPAVVPSSGNTVQVTSAVAAQSQAPPTQGGGGAAGGGLTAFPFLAAGSPFHGAPVVSANQNQDG